MIKNNFSWKIAGAAGDGIVNAGLFMFAKTCLRGGLNVIASAEYPSLIRGGHNHLDVRVSDEAIYSHTKHISILLALNKESINNHASKMLQGGGIIYDKDEINVEEKNYPDIRLYPMPLMKISNECGGKIMRNVVGIGATFALTGFDMKLVDEIIKENFGRKGQQIVDGNIKAAHAGYDYIKSNFADDFKFKLETTGNKNSRIFISGNQAIALGAIKAGCKFLSAYPMTPATSIMTTMASMEKDASVVVKHTEDEIAAVNMAIGANFAGCRAMTCTSGGGFALMVEGLGLASQTETPVVIVDSQRPGPATGMATHTGQADLRFVLHASQDEFPRIVIAPGDINDSFFLTIDAFNIAEKYQLPVIILSDKFLGEGYWSVNEFDTSDVKIERGKLITGTAGEDYKRYKVTENDPISPRAIPGTSGGMHVASSYEHDEHGFECENEEVRMMMHKKRFMKLEAAAKEIPQPKIYGDANAEITVICWGSTKSPMKEAMKILKKEKTRVNMLHIAYISPLPTAAITSAIQKANNVVIVEGNMTSQLAGLIRQETGIEIKNKILKFDGRPFAPEDLAKEIRNFL